MCGIAGYVDTNGACREIVDAQLATMPHRGSDARGCFVAGPVAIGQNRLAVIDLVCGDPPIANEDDTIGVVLNGEIYNFDAIRRALRMSGHALQTRGDTEVIAHLSEDQRPKDVARALDGMFAYAVWDSRRSRLILGRDRLGKKPLYYFAQNGQFVFSSEIKGVLANPMVAATMDADAIPAYLKFGYVPTPRTFFHGIHSIPPGHVLVVEPGGTPAVEPFWTPPTPSRQARFRGTFSDAADVTRRRLTEAVGRRLVADVPLGAFLSGGIDSSIIVGIMSQILGQKVRTFTIGFDDDEGFDERPFAAAVARHFGTEHTEFVVAPHTVDLVEQLVWHHDQPFGDSSAIPTFLLSELTRQHVTVALSGDGGDETFAGYERFAAASYASAYRRLPRPVRQAVETGLSYTPDRVLRGRVASARRLAARAHMEMPDAYLGWISFVPDEYIGQLLERPSQWASESYRAMWNQHSGGALLDRLLDFNLRTYLLDDLLVKTDRMSMAHTLEVRSPFLDAAVVEFAASLPPGFKFRGVTLKRVLKHAFRDVLPHEILTRRKRGFGVPLDRWFRTSLRSYLHATLGPNARIRRRLAGTGVDTLLAEHDRGAANHGHALWTLLTLEIFLRQHAW